MKANYEIDVCGVVRRRICVEADSVEAAEAYAKGEFVSLTGAYQDIEVIETCEVDV